MCGDIYFCKLLFYQVSGTSDEPDVYVFAKRPSTGNYKKILSLVGSRVISPYTDRLTGWRNISFTLVTIRNLSPEDYTNYRITIEYTSLAENVEAITTLEKGGRKYFLLGQLNTVDRIL